MNEAYNPTFKNEAKPWKVAYLNQDKSEDPEWVKDLEGDIFMTTFNPDQNVHTDMPGGKTIKPAKIKFLVDDRYTTHDTNR